MGGLHKPLVTALPTKTPGIPVTALKCKCESKNYISKTPSNMTTQGSITHMLSDCTNKQL